MAGSRPVRLNVRVRVRVRCVRVRFRCVRVRVRCVSVSVRVRVRVKCVRVRVRCVRVRLQLASALGYVFRGRVTKSSCFGQLGIELTFSSRMSGLGFGFDRDARVTVEVHRPDIDCGWCR